jgi:hypothetical protein
MARYRQVRPAPASGLAGMPATSPGGPGSGAPSSAAAPHASGSLHPQTQSRLLATHEAGGGGLYSC